MKALIFAFAFAALMASGETLRLKSTSLGKKFADFVKDGNSHRSVVKVAFAKDDTFDDLLEIQDFEPLPTPE